MEALTVAIISAAAVMVSAIITGIFTTRKTNSFIKDNTKDGEHNKQLLTSEHGNLSKEHNGLSKEHSLILDKSKDIQTTVSGMCDIMIENKAKRESQYANLTDSQKQLEGGIKAIEMLFEQLKIVQTDNVRLRDENRKLKLQIKRFTQQPSSDQDDDLEMEL